MSDVALQAVGLVRRLDGTVSHTLSIQLVGLVIGAFVFAVLAIVLGAGRRRKVEPPAPATSPPAAA